MAVHVRDKDHEPQVSIITPTQLEPGRLPWLVDLHTSLTSNQATWEWIIVVDGVDPDPLPAQLVADARVSVVALPRRVGAACARNVGLSQAQAEWITSCDDDDRLPEAAIDLRVHAVDEQVHWVGAKLAELFVRTGELRRWDHPAPSGHLSPGEVWRSWASPGAEVPVGPTTLLVRRPLLRAVGGWQGLPQAEDLGMAVAVTSTAPGIMLDEVVYHYRKHPGMMRRSPGFDLLEASSLHAVWERGRCLVEA